jgi:hypothetical protein
MNFLVRASLVTLLFVGLSPAHADIIIRDYFQLESTNVTCTGNAGVNDCRGRDGLPFRFEFDLREGLYDPASPISETNLTAQRALEYVYFSRPYGTGGLGIIGTNFHETRPDARLWNFSASGLDLDGGESCIGCASFAFSLSLINATGSSFYWDFSSSADGSFLFNAREESMQPGGPVVRSWTRYTGTSAQLTHVHTETFADGTPVPEVSVPEPGTFALFGLAFAGLGLTRRVRASPRAPVAA